MCLFLDSRMENGYNTREICLKAGKQNGEQRVKKESKSTNKMNAIWPIAVVVLCAIIGVVLMVWGDKAQNKEEQAMEENGWKDYKEQFGKGLDKNGLLKDIEVSDYVTLCDYQSMEIPSGSSKEKKQFVTEYLLENCTVKDCPEYLADLEERIRFVLVQSYKDNEEHFYQAYDKYQFEDVYDAYDMTQEEFDQYITDKAKEEMKRLMIFQSIFEKEGYEVEKADIEEYILSIGYEKEDVEGIYYQHGEPYLRRMAMESVVLEHLIKQ